MSDVARAPVPQRAPRTIVDPAELAQVLTEARGAGERIGFVPTMGALHEGHLRLVDALRAPPPSTGLSPATLLVASVFVNPTQFGPNEDLARYPRDLEGDRQKLGSRGVHIVFAPTPELMYPQGEATRVRVSQLTDHLCGPFRPGHFEGVTTVVAKFFGMVGPCVASFGRKDYQQLAVLRRMVKDLHFPVEVLGVPTCREADGLAMSSRNAYLSSTDRVRAVGIPRAISQALRAHAGGERRAGTLRGELARNVAAAMDSVDYAEVADPDTLQPFEDDAAVPERALFVVAARIGGTRLIDNAVSSEDSPATAAVP
jgi:pantoate--beta-alanine ligase